MTTFRARIVAVSGGGHYVDVPVAVADKAALASGARVRGSLGGIAYRSALMKHGDAFQLGVHKATLAAAEAQAGDVVSVSIERDPEPLPTDTIPPSLAAALKRTRGAAEAFARLAPSRRREHVRNVNEAKRDETRAARVAKIIASLAPIEPAAPRAKKKR